MRAVLEQFTGESGIETGYEGVERVSERLLEHLETGQMPDVLLLPVPDWLQELAGAGAIPPLADEVAGVVRDNFTSSWVDFVSHEGRVYGVPFDANAKSLLWYRREQLPELEVDPPAGLQDLYTLAQELEAHGQAAFAVAGGVNWTLTDWFENVLLATSGTETYDALITHRIAWTDPEVEAATRQFVSLLRPAWVMGGTEGAINAPLLADTFYQAFDPAAPGAALWLGQSSIVMPWLQEGTPHSPDHYDVFLFPTGGVVIVAGSVATGTNNDPATAALLDFLARPEAVEPWVREGGFVSPNRAIPLDAYPTDIARHEAELVVNAPAFRYDLSDRLPPNLGFPFLGERLAAMLREPAAIPAILAEIEEVATREQGAPGR
jgi:alpha-glucoside transport system substrate-binding protein